MKKYLVIIAAIMVVSASILTASAAASPKAAPASAMDQLYQLAKKEGNVVFAFGDPVVQYTGVIDAFQKRFPGIKVTALFVLPPDVAPRIITESGANRVSLDVSVGSISSYIPLLDRNLIAKNDWTGLVDPKSVFLDGQAIRLFDLPWGAFYNKKLIPAAAVPKTWQDLLNPSLKGKITLPAPFVDLVSLFFTWGDQKAADYVTKLKGQNINVTTGGTTCMTKVINGEMSVGVSSMYTAIGQYKAAGAADFIDWLAMSPHLVSLYPMYTFKGSPHPNAAKLIMAWLNTPEGMAATAATGRGAMDSPTPVEAFTIIKTKGIQIYHENTMDESKADDQYRVKIAQLLGYVPGKK